MLWALFILALLTTNTESSRAQWLLQDAHTTADLRTFELQLHPAWPICWHVFGLGTSGSLYSIGQALKIDDSSSTEHSLIRRNARRWARTMMTSCLMAIRRRT
jgi:hypothetical protein